MLTDLDSREFTGLLASAEAVPGGGGAAALCGALGAALCSMAARLTVDKKKFAPHKEVLTDIIARSDGLRKELLRLIDADAEGFAPLAQAYSLPKAAEERSDIIRRATLAAMQAPFAMTKYCCEAIDLTEKLTDGRCSTLLISDAGCAAALCAGALQCSAMNVFINTRTLRGDAESDAIERETRALLAEYLPRAEALSKKITLLLSEEQ
ncbi:MAG: cyclodeaminase/cyclohydrolase family protein [Oscillospiraceae bacterium]|nr:cyclodeaminase/cyclohydrolase family protein [Oscillospiraceae bacterium]